MKVQGGPRQDGQMFRLKVGVPSHLEETNQSWLDVGRKYPCELSREIFPTLLSCELDTQCCATILEFISSDEGLLAFLLRDHQNNGSPLTLPRSL